MFNNMFLYIIRNKSGYLNFNGTKKNDCYRWFPMISGHGTKKLLSIGFEILGLVPPRLFHLLSFADKKLRTALQRNLQL